MLQDNVLHDGVDVAVSPLDGTVNIQRGCARRFVHGRHRGLCSPRGVYGANLDIVSIISFNIVAVWQEAQE
jgi:hypothetical protein